MRRLVRDCHETPKAKKAHRGGPGNCSVRWWNARSSSSFPDGAGREAARQRHFAGRFFDGPGIVALFAETLPLIDPEQPDYALVLLTLVESILEDPDIILRKQLDKLKTQKMAEMKMEGLEYDERMEELEKLEHPKPNREFVYSTFNDFADAASVGGPGKHPSEVHRAGDVRVVPLLLRLHPRLRIAAGRRGAAPPSERRFQDARPNRARRGQERRRCAKWNFISAR